jgi:hypothetical protein
METILSKKQNYRLWQSGAFGNKLHAWQTVSAWRASGFVGNVTVRCILPIGGSGPFSLQPFAGKNACCVEDFTKHCPRPSC